MSRSCKMNQVEKVTAMYYSCLYYWTGLDFGQVSRWINGKQALTGAVAEYYGDMENLLHLPDDIRIHLFPVLVDKKAAAGDLHDLIMQDDSLSVEKRQELSRRYPADGEDGVEFFLGDLFYFAACRPFVPEKKGPSKLAGGNGILSPDVSERIRDAKVSLPVKHYTGREQELEELHNLLLNNKAVFLHGIAGIGKSELSREYARIHKKDYTNILTMTYGGDLKKDIRDLVFTDDIMDEDDGRRFERHDRYLRTLKGDTLLIIDNFDTAEDQEPFLPEMLACDCRILFTSRYLWEDHACLELSEMEDMHDLMEMAMKLYPEGALDPAAVERIIDSVHRHTYAVELASRLLARGILTVDELLVKLEETPFAPDSDDKIRARKDGSVRKETYKEHIRLLFALFALDDMKQTCLGNLSMIPQKGILRIRFVQLAGHTSMNQVNDLIEMGIVHEGLDGAIRLHPLIRDLIYSDISPDDIMCEALCNNLRETSSRMGADLTWYHEIDEIIMNIIRHMKKIRWDFYLHFLQDVFFHADKYDNSKIKKKILHEMKVALKMDRSSTKEDLAMYYDYLATDCRNPLRAVTLTEKAVRILPSNTDRGLLKINIYQNLFIRYLKGTLFELASDWCLKVDRLYNEHPEWRDHNWLVFQVNRGVLLVALKQYTTALMVFEGCRRLMVDAGMEGTLDYENVIENIAHLQYILGRYDLGRKCFDECCGIYEQVYQNDPVRIREQKERVQKAEDSLVEKLNKKKKLLTG